jgi:hypothetical protein
MSVKLVPTFADRGCRVVSATDLHGRILGFLDRSRYYFFQVAPQLYSRGWVDPVPDPQLLRKSSRAGNRTRDLLICSQKLWPLDHKGGLRFLTGKRNFSVTYSVQTGPGDNPISYQMGTEVFFQGVKRPGREPNHSAPSSAEVKNDWALPPLPSKSSWCGD